MKAVFVITGVCEQGRTLNLDLARFLAHDDHRQVLWVDFKGPDDFSSSKQTVTEALPNTQICAAPNAVWGGASIVNSMLAAVAHCARHIPEWTHLVFCAMHDVPLAPRTVLISALSEIADKYDYVGSRWNANAWDLVGQLERAPCSADLLAERLYERFTIRGTTTIWREVALAEEFPPQNINSLRLCNDLFERYLVSVSENVVNLQLSIYRMTPGRATERFAFFSRFGLHAGRQWCVLSRRLCDLLLSDYVDDVFHDWFGDVLIPDECFFQTIASHYEKIGRIRAFWKNLYLHDAQNTAVWPNQLAKIAATRAPHELFVRKSAAPADFAAILDERQQDKVT